MKTYRYKARNKFGRLVHGSLSADSEIAVAAKLKEFGFTPVSINEEELKNSKVLSCFNFNRVKPSELNMFTRQFYVLQKAGVTILSSLTVLRLQTTNKFFKNILSEITRDIEAGVSLSVALERYPGVFGATYINMIKSGEASGTLETILQRLTDLGEREELTRKRIKAATRYPVIIIAVMIIGFLVLTTLVMPRFAKLYSRFTVALPLPTQILLGINHAVTKFWWLMIIAGLICGFFFKKFIRTEKGAFFWDYFKLKVPVFGPLSVKLAVSRFARLTAILMYSGVPIMKILELVSESVGNKVISKTVNTIKSSVNEGKGMSEPMKISGVFPPIVIQMVSVGESIGKVDELLLHVSDYYDSEVDYTINNLTSLLEPMLIIFLGCAVLLMALGVFLPMWNLMSLFKH